MFQADLTARATQFGNYQIVRKIASGGMAEVYEAYRVGSENFQTRVALKCIRPELTANDRFRGMFINEAHLGSTLHHPNIVQIQDFNRVDEIYYLAMEYVEGTDLATFMNRVAETGEPLPRAAVIDLSLQAMSGMGYAHEARSPDGTPMNIVHRDIKPSNFLLSRQGTVKIADFGIAKASTNTYQTQTQDHIKGTLKYMSPEQVDGAPLGPATDLFSFAAILFELITLRELFDAPGIAATLIKIATANIAPDLALLEERWPEIGEVLRKCLHRDPAQRYLSAHEAAKALRTLDSPLNIEGALERYLRRHPDLFDDGAVHSPQTLNMSRSELPSISQDTDAIPVTASGDKPAVADALSLLGDRTSVSLEPPPPEAIPPAARHVSVSNAAAPAKEKQGFDAQGTEDIPAAPPAADLPEGDEPASDEDDDSSALAHEDSEMARTLPFSVPKQAHAASDDEGEADDEDSDEGKEDVAVALAAAAPPVAGSNAAAAPSMDAGGAIGGDTLHRPPPATPDEDAELQGFFAPPPAEPAEAQPTPSKGGRLVWLIAAAAVLLALGMGWWLSRGPASMASPAYLKISTTPPGAKILIDGSYIGEVSPARVELPTDKRNVLLSLEAKSFVPVSESLSYGEGQELVKEFVLQLAAQSAGSIRVTSTPEGAAVFLNAQDTGKLTPTVLTDVPPGVHAVELRLEGFEPSRVEDLQVESDQQASRAVVLEPIPTPEPTPARSRPKPAAVPKPRPQVTQPAVPPPATTLPSGKPSPVEDPRAAAADVAVTFNTFPPDASINVDGTVRQVDLPATLQLPVGRHEVVFTYQGKTARAYFEVKAGTPKKVVYNFNKGQWLAR